MDIRNKKFAEMIVNYSCDVQPGEKVLIEEVGTDAKPLIKEIIKEVYKAGGQPFLGLSDSSLTGRLSETAQRNRWNTCANIRWLR